MLLSLLLKPKAKYKMRPTTGAKKITAAQKIFTGLVISCRLLSVIIATIKTINHIIIAM
jgi:hypothetical protein